MGVISKGIWAIIGPWSGRRSILKNETAEAVSPLIICQGPGVAPRYLGKGEGWIFIIPEGKRSIMAWSKKGGPKATHKPKAKSPVAPFEERGREIKFLILSLMSEVNSSI